MPVLSVKLIFLGQGLSLVFRVAVKSGRKRLSKPASVARSLLQGDRQLMADSTHVTPAAPENTI